MDVITHILMILLSGISFFSDLEISAKRVPYFSTERPRITYVNSDYITFVNMTSQRNSRRDPFYYVQIHFQTQVPFGNEKTVHIYFYEFLSNQYKRGFVEIHIRICDMVNVNKMFSSVLKKFLPSTCPIPQGVYHLYNITIPLDQVPRGFPFTKGRVYFNFTDDRKNTLISSAHIDLELKTVII